MLTGSFDPIGLGLTVTKVSVTDGVGGIAAGPVLTGSTVRLTPAAGFVGDIVVAADITDGTKDPERVVTANLRVSIQDKPSAPGTPALVDGTLDREQRPAGLVAGRRQRCGHRCLHGGRQWRPAGLPRVRDLLRHRRSHRRPALRLRGDRAQLGR